MQRSFTQHHSCTNFDLAQYYFPEVLDYMRGDLIGAEWTSYIHDTDFDYNSIMMYSSFQNSRNPGHVRLGWVLQRHTPGHPRHGLAVNIWQEGAEEPANRHPSAKDAERVAAMYPLR